MKKSHRAGMLAVPLVLAACATLPNGPGVMALPGAGKGFDAFQSDDAACRMYAGNSLGGQSAEQAQTESGAKSAAIGTAVGALAGAAMGGHRGAGTGAGLGLLAGAAAGSASANESGHTLQQRYDNAYVQCMYAKGNQVPVSGPVRYAGSRRHAPPDRYYQAPPPPPPPIER